MPGRSGWADQAGPIRLGRSGWAAQAGPLRPWRSGHRVRCRRRVAAESGSGEWQRRVAAESAGGASRARPASSGPSSGANLPWSSGIGGGAQWRRAAAVRWCNGAGLRQPQTALLGVLDRTRREKVPTFLRFRDEIGKTRLETARFPSRAPPRELASPQSAVTNGACPSTRPPSSSVQSGEPVQGHGSCRGDVERVDTGRHCHPHPPAARQHP